MCGIFGIIATRFVDKSALAALARHAQQRGRDSGGLLTVKSGHVVVRRADYGIVRLVRDSSFNGVHVALGHSRLITNGLADNQPVIRDGICVFHNGIVVNHSDLWSRIDEKPRQQIDTEVIAAIAARHLRDGGDIEGIATKVLALCRGVVACAIAIPAMGKLCLFSNNGSLYSGQMAGAAAYASEEHPLRLLGCSSIRQVRTGIVLGLPAEAGAIEVSDCRKRRRDLIPNLASGTSSEERMLLSPERDLRRCARCILPHTMPFITFDKQGFCNYCRHYRLRNIPRPKAELLKLLEPYRRTSGTECIVPFSGGRDSCYGLHLIVKELKMRPVSYTYDWGMVTDLGRRNISRMCGELGVENIIIAEDIAKKRNHIRMNLKAWLRSPHLGMISILTAGDKHFFRHVETVKRQTGVQLNLWGVNPLEVTHFKAGFLGVPPDFLEDRVYSHGIAKQFRYQWLRLKAMLQSPTYFNSSLWDTLSGEYHRSFTRKKDYFHIFDFWRWDENAVDDTLAQYDWEKATDTSTTWRIGDGTAAFYNYVYHKVAGFSEHDTFRSNQIREGDLSRERALELVVQENRPRYPNIKWYLDAVGLDFREVIAAVNAIPPLEGGIEVDADPGSS